MSEKDPKPKGDGEGELWRRRLACHLPSEKDPKPKGDGEIPFTGRITRRLEVRDL